MSIEVTPQDREWEELRLLLDRVYERYGYDFRGYSPPMVRRRIRALQTAERAGSLAELADLVVNDPDRMRRLLRVMSIRVTSMFRDPGYFRALREKVVPVLRTYPFVRVWVAGCSTGEEAYSLAIVLREEGMMGKSQIYATDLSEEVLARAEDGIFPLEKMRTYTSNYVASGGREEFSSYYTAAYDNARILPALKENILFAHHSLVSDGPFNEFHLVSCRNVLIYFDQYLVKTVHHKLYESLADLGYLGLGRKESLAFSGLEKRYEAVDGFEKIFRRRKT